MPFYFQSKGNDLTFGYRNHDAVIYTQSINVFGISFSYWQVPGTNEDDPQCKHNQESFEEYQRNKLRAIAEQQSQHSSERAPPFTEAFGFA